ncbi:hypothetical protein F5Y16DRAFT_278053 [Xylariaceae sp. FL0255]|nr:hypothetical protein F5Y16DRAFT_278053 [Xylariaceae sp. FL0255]
MYSSTVISTATAVLLVSSVLAQRSTVYFNCNSTTAAGFTPKCCTNMNGQVGISCLTAFQEGINDPIYDCNLYVYNISGCCQSTGYRNPVTNLTIDLCATSIDQL